MGVVAFVCFCPSCSLFISYVCLGALYLLGHFHIPRLLVANGPGHLTRKKLGSRRWSVLAGWFACWLLAFFFGLLVCVLVGWVGRISWCFGFSRTRASFVCLFVCKFPYDSSMCFAACHSLLRGRRTLVICSRQRNKQSCNQIACGSRMRSVQQPMFVVVCQLCVA